MALGNNNISLTAVYAELAGSSSPMPAITTPSKPWPLSTLCAVSGQSPYSFYGTGSLGVDSNKNLVWTAPASNYKLGDFRSYNHAAAILAPPNNFTQYYTAGASSIDVVMASFPYECNILFADSGAVYITYNAYTTTAYRAAAWSSPATNRYDTATNSALFNTITALAGHTRTQTQKIHSTHVDTFTAFDLTGITSTPDQILYFEVFFSNISGTRLISFGNAASGGYYQITFHEYQDPTLEGGANVTPAPSGYTAIWPAVGSASTPVCIDTFQTYSNVDTTYDVWLSMRGVYGGGQRVHEVTSCDVALKVGGSSATIATGVSLGYSSKTRFQGTIPGGLSGGNFSYDEVWTVEVSNVTWGSNYSTC